MSARRLLAASMVLAALLAAGCGADTGASNAYVDQVNLAQTQLSSSFTRLAREYTVSSPPAQNRKTLRSIEAAMETTVADLRKIDPPDDVKAQHADLVEALAGYGESLGEAASNLSGTDAQATLAQSRLTTDTKATSTRVAAAISSINQKLRN